MLLHCPSQIGSAAPAVRSQSVAQRAVDAEFILSSLGRLGIACQRIAVVGCLGGNPK